MRANNGEPVEKALMASSSVAVTSEDSANSNLTTLVAPAEYLLGEVREPLSGGASTLFSGGASTPSGVRASPETVRPSPAPVPATARTGVDIRNNSVHRPNVVRRHAVAELTGAVTRYRGLRPNKNNKDDDKIINNKKHAALAECFQPSTLHKLRQLGLSTKKVTPDDNNIYNNNDAAMAERFQPSTLHKLRQLGLYTNTDTLDDNDINNNNHAALAERFQPSTLHKLRQLGRCTNTDTTDTAYQLDAEAVPAEVAYTRSNTEPSCSGVVVVVVDSHIQRIVLATEETTVTQQVSHRPIKRQSRLWSQRGTKVNGSHHGDNPLLRPTGIQIATKSYAALQAMAPTNIKTVDQTSLLHSRATSIDSECCRLPTTSVLSKKPEKLRSNQF